MDTPSHPYSWAGQVSGSELKVQRVSTLSGNMVPLRCVYRLACLSFKFLPLIGGPNGVNTNRWGSYAGSMSDTDAPVPYTVFRFVSGTLSSGFFPSANPAPSHIAVHGKEIPAIIRSYRYSIGIIFAGNSNNPDRRVAWELCYEPTSFQNQRVVDKNMTVP